MNQITELITAISRLTTEISLQGEHDVFLRLSSHVCYLHVDIFLNGWSVTSKPDRVYLLRYNPIQLEKDYSELIISELKEIVEDLLSLKTTGKLINKGDSSC